MPVSLHCCWLSSTTVQVLTADRISRSTGPARFEVVSRRWRAGSSHAALHFLRLPHMRGARRVHAWDDLSVKRCGVIGVKRCVQLACCCQARGRHVVGMPCDRRNSALDSPVRLSRLSRTISKGLLKTSVLGSFHAEN